MKHLLMCLAVLLLSSCANIKVDDFGSYWEKGYVDPALVGQWQLIEPKYDDDRKEERSIKAVFPISKVVNDNGAYKIDSLIKEERQKKDYEPQIGRILKIGRYEFLMIGLRSSVQDGRLKSGEINRFIYTDGKIIPYNLNAKKMSAFLNTVYPSVKNIVAGCAELKPVADPNTNQLLAEKSKHECKFFNTRILKFDSDVFKIISEIPDTEEYWSGPEEIGYQILVKTKK